MTIPARRETCTWTYDDSECSYHTECGETFCYENDKGVRGNGAFYCHHCGGVLRVVSKCYECGVELPGESDNICDRCAREEEADDA